MPSGSFSGPCTAHLQCIKCNIVQHDGGQNDVTVEPLAQRNLQYPDHTIPANTPASSASQTLKRAFRKMQTDCTTNHCAQQ